jgi:hypothetical protein
VSNGAGLMLPRRFMRELQSFELKPSYEDVFQVETSTVEEYLQQMHEMTVITAIQVGSVENDRLSGVSVAGAMHRDVHAGADTQSSGLVRRRSGSPTRPLKATCRSAWSRSGCTTSASCSTRCCLASRRGPRRTSRRLRCHFRGPLLKARTRPLWHARDFEESRVDSARASAGVGNPCLERQKAKCCKPQVEHCSTRSLSKELTTVPGIQ